MKKRYLKHLVALGGTWLGLCSNAGWAIAAERVNSLEMLEREKFTFQVRNASVRSVAELIAEKAGLELQFPAGSEGRISFSVRNQTLLDALDLIVSRTSLEYDVEGRVLVFRASGADQRAGRGARRPASAGSSSSGGVHSIPLQFNTTREVLANLKSMLGDGENLFSDETSNTLIFQGSEHTYSRLLEVLPLLDQMPTQILIDAQIVETTRTAMEALGLSYGALENPNPVKVGEGNPVASLPGPASPNLSLAYRIGTVGSSALDLKLAAAESAGNAKVVSRPKVVTLNNTLARVTSGISFHVKTIAALTGNQGQPTAGGVQRLQSGLQLNVTPTIMGKELIRLKLDIDNSQPDESSSVDGIPGIVSNAANTSVIVGQGRTAVIAGLIKNSKSHSNNAVPVLSKMPVIGPLFSNLTDSDRNNELVIFITPQVVTPENDLRAMGALPASVPPANSTPNATATP